MRPCANRSRPRRTGHRRCRLRRIPRCSSAIWKSPSGPIDVKLTHYAMRSNKPAAYIAAAVLALGAVFPAWAQLKIEITSGVTDPVPIAVVPFARAVPADGGLDVALVIQHDLEGSGRFRALQHERMPARPTTANGVVLADWKSAGSDYVIVGRV